MNILLIGNGFDLAHGLPTKYTDFLEWIVGEYEFYYDLRKQKDNITHGIKEIQLDIPEDKTRKKNINKRISQSHQVELWGCIDSNIWFEYFLYSQLRQNSTWIDFESEISEVIQSIDANMKGNLNEFVTQLDNWYLNKKFVDSQLDYGVGKIEYLKFGELRDLLLFDLNRLIRAFEIYLCEYVEKQGIEEINTIKSIHPDCVLSFNYTNTYEIIYGGRKDIEYDYIHGKADIKNDMDTNNMVLGIDEYLPDDRVNRDVEFISFKKYYQRIHKETGCKYREWADKIRCSITESEAKLKNTFPMQIPYEKFVTKHKLYIFGHSLDVTDKDVLRDLILNDNVYTTIYYYNRSAYGQQIANLVKVIGKDELIRRTGGSTKTIKFKMQ